MQLRGFTEPREDLDTLQQVFGLDRRTACDYIFSLIKGSPTLLPFPYFNAICLEKSQLNLEQVMAKLSPANAIHWMEMDSHTLINNYAKGMNTLPDYNLNSFTCTYPLNPNQK